MNIYKQPINVIQSQYDHDPWVANLIDVIIKQLGSRKGRVLDVGCGTGRLSIELAKRGFEVIGVDIEAKAVEIAQRAARKERVGVTFWQLDVIDIVETMGTGSFDIVVCSEVLEHVDNYEHMLYKIFDVLRVGGTFVFTVPHDPAQWSVLDEYMGHKRRFTIEQLLEIPMIQQFKVERCFTTGFPFSRALIGLHVLGLKRTKTEVAPVQFWGQGLLGTVGYWAVRALAKVDQHLTWLGHGTTIVCKARKQ